jgi:hypothetical protein
MIPIQRTPDAPVTLFDPARLHRVDGGFENAHERTASVEYRLDGRLVHRSAHVTLKEWPGGMGAELSRFFYAPPSGPGITPSDRDPDAPSRRHLRALAHLKTGGARFANTQAMCSQFKVDILNGLHAFGTSVIRAGTTKDAYKAALYLVSATRGAGDTVYSASGEVSGAGYAAGGVAVTTATGPTLSSTTAIFTPSASIVYTTVTLATAFDAMLLYNDTSATDLAVAVFTFGSQTVTAGTFTLTMPVNDAANALIRIA